MYSCSDVRAYILHCAAYNQNLSATVTGHHGAGVAIDRRRSADGAGRKNGHPRSSEPDGGVVGRGARRQLTSGDVKWPTCQATDDV